MAAKTKSSWFDEELNTPLISEHAQRLDGFLAAVADGKVEAHEVKTQEARLVKLMKEIEPQLDDELHGKITELLCEMTAYDLMTFMHTLSEARPKTKFRG